MIAGSKITKTESAATCGRYAAEQTLQPRCSKPSRATSADGMWRSKAAAQQRNTQPRPVHQLRAAATPPSLGSGRCSDPKATTAPTGHDCWHSSACCSRMRALTKTQSPATCGTMPLSSRSGRCPEAINQRRRDVTAGPQMVAKRTDSGTAAPGQTGASGSGGCTGHHVRESMPAARDSSCVAWP